MVCLWVALVFWASAVQANPWPREKGEVFVALSGTYRYGLDTGRRELDGDAYLEYGLTDRRTLGFSGNHTRIDYSHAFVFLRQALSPPNQQLKLAGSLGVGASRQDQDWGPMLRLDMSVGRATELWGSGWWSVTAAIEHHELWEDPLFKLDGTFGLTVTPRLKALVDLETSQRRGVPNAITLRGSVAWAVKKRTHLVMGLEAKDIDETFLGLRLGFWQTF